VLACCELPELWTAPADCPGCLQMSDQHMQEPLREQHTNEGPNDWWASHTWRWKTKQHTPAA